MSGVAPAPQLRSELTVSGMMCGHCVHEALSEIPGVQVRVALDSCAR